MITEVGLPNIFECQYPGLTKTDTAQLMMDDDRRSIACCVNRMTITEYETLMNSLIEDGLTLAMEPSSSACNQTFMSQLQVQYTTHLNYIDL